MSEVLSVRTQCPEHVAWWDISVSLVHRGAGGCIGSCPLF